MMQNLFMICSEKTTNLIYGLHSIFNLMEATLRGENRYICIVLVPKHDLGLQTKLAILLNELNKMKVCSNIQY